MAEAAPFSGVTYCGLIGQGSFGAVHLVENDDKEQFAVKVMPMSGASPKDKGVARNEANVLRVLKHDHVLIYMDSWLHEGSMYIITEFCAGGDLSVFLDRVDEHLPEDLLLAWLWQMACGLEYMHTFEPTPIYHRDLKPSNIYLTDTGDIRLGDMGIARILESPNVMVESFCGTPAYMSPEVLFERPYDGMTDIWSLGCCLAEMITLERAYDGSTLHVLRHAVLRGPPPLPRGYSEDLRLLLTGMLKLKCEERPSATSILDDSFLVDYENVQPMNLLREHKLLDKLGMRRGQPTPASTSMSSSASSSTTQTLDLDKGQSLTEYRDKVRTRMRGRRQDETLRNSGTFNTSALHTCRKTESKWKKKTLVTVVRRDTSQTVVPAKEQESRDSSTSGVMGADRASKSDTSLSSRLLASFSNSLSVVQSQRFGPQTAHIATLADSQAVGQPSLLDQMNMLKTMLKAMLDEETWNKACALVMSATSTSDLLKGLAPLLGDLTDELSNVLIYCFLADSVRQSSQRSSSSS